jgi:hypothetical protein
MAPKREHRLNKKRDNKSRNHHTSSNSNFGKAGTITSTNNSASVEWSSATNSDETSQFNATTTHHSQTSEEATYLLYDRPWTQDTTIYHYNTTIYGTSPMERWQNESMLGGPYHAIEGATIIEGQYNVLDFNNVSIDEGRAKGFDNIAEEMGSMAYEAPTSDK